MKDGFIKVAAVTPKIEVANVTNNKEIIASIFDELEKNAVQLAVFPELVLTGYTCNDLFLQDLLLDKVETELLDLAKLTKSSNCISVIGAPLRFNGKLYNCGVVIGNGTILGVVPKTNIPNYSEFYELRHFESGRDIYSETISLGNSKVPFGRDLLFQSEDVKEFIFGVEICEDLWVANPPSIDLTRAGALIIANLSASDEVIGKAEYRRNLVLSQSGRLCSGYIYASAGDGESTQDLVFSGHNMIAENGSMLKETELFNNEIIISEIDVKKLAYERRKQNTFEIDVISANVINFKSGVKETILTRDFSRFPFVPQNDLERNQRCKLILSMQANGLKKRIEHIRAKKIVVGLSGGLDSALALLVMVTAMDMLSRDRKDIVAVTLPCFGTTKRTKSNAQVLAESLNVDFRDVCIKDAVIQHFKDIGQDENKLDVTYENSQARERTQVLMDIANKEGGIVIGTGDLSELALGWATYNGDHMSMYGVNASIPKTLVRYLVKYYAETSNNKKIHDTLIDILDTPVSPELLPAKDGKIAQKTEDLVGPYELHDFYLYYAIRWGFSPSKVYRLAIVAFNDVYSKEVILKWLRNFYSRFFAQQFKRSCIPDGPKVGTVTLSPRGDWRMPSDAVNKIWMEEVDKLN